MVEQVRQYTKAEVALNNGINNSRLWIIIKNGVYDLTDYLNQHPGGADLLLEYGGKDGTDAFYESGHSSDAEKRMALYKIGVILRETKSGNLNNKSVKNKSSTRRSFLRKICGPCTL